MSELDSKSELAQIEAKIVALCSGALAGRDYYLLSELGKSLGDDLGRLKVLGHLKLSEYISDRLSDRFKVVSVGFNNVMAVAHADRCSSAGQYPKENQNTSEELSS